jgi:hypothetical protein
VQTKPKDEKNNSEFYATFTKIKEEDKLIGEDIIDSAKIFGKQSKEAMKVIANEKTSSFFGQKRVESHSFQP